MVRLLHSADWQLGARFTQFGAQAGRLRQARLQTLEKTLALAVQRGVDAFLVAGDLFDDNLVDDTLVAAVLALFAAQPTLPIFLLPGNHDPLSGPESVWERRAFRQVPAHVHVLRETGVVALGVDAFLLAAPLRQKLSREDPSRPLGALAAALPVTALKIGLTHGALAIEAKHQPDEFPVALDAASRAGLDYLALGHWHNWLEGFDGGRLLMPGTPEPDQFSHDGSGHVALVELDGPGLPPRIEKLPVATLAWKSLSFDFLSPEASRATLGAALAEALPAAAATVLRLTLTGSASPTDAQAAREWVRSVLAPFPIHQLRDEARLVLNALELADLQTQHPILAQVLSDLDRLEAVVAGSPPADSAMPPLSLAEAQALVVPSRLDLTSLPPGFFGQVRQVLFQTLQEVNA